MTDYDNSNRLSLWLNDKREKQTHPHLKGQGETDIGVWVSAWFAQDISDEDKKALMGIVKRHRDASKRPFLSISIQPKDQQQPAQQPAQQSGGFEDDDIPF